MSRGSAHRADQTPTTTNSLITIRKQATACRTAWLMLTAEFTKSPAKSRLSKRGSASEWWSINKKNGYYNYGQEPQIGAIACWSNHVAIVEKIDGNTVTASQSHWGGNYFDTTTFKSGTNRFGQKFYGYIYACEKINEEVEQEKAEEEARIAAEEKAAEDAKSATLRCPRSEPEYIVPETSSAPSVSANLTGEEPKIVLNSIVLKKQLKSKMQICIDLI